MIASLGMYDSGVCAEANDVLWAAIASRLVALGLRDVPQALTRDVPLDVLWDRSDLLFAQTCGFPFATRHRGRLRLVAAPRYSAAGCTKDGHRSFVVVAADAPFGSLASLRGARAAINEWTSLTGAHLLGDTVRGAGFEGDFFHGFVVTGSHAASVAAVADGSADVAAIDCVTYAHLADEMPALVGKTRVLGQSRVVPTLPFVVSRALGEVAHAMVLRALQEAMLDPATAFARRVLRLESVRRANPASYDAAIAIAGRAAPILDGPSPRAAS